MKSKKEEIEGNRRERRNIAGQMKEQKNRRQGHPVSESLWRREGWELRLGSPSVQARYAGTN